VDTSGWAESADSWISTVEHDPNRGLLLDPVMLARLGVVRGLRVLDVGCGEGRFCRMLGDRGAQCVGVDPTERLIHEARTRHSAGWYLRASGEALPLASAAFDIVVSYVALVDIPDFRAAIREKARVLRPGGRLVIANLNSFVTSQPWGWHRDENRVRLHYPVDHYNEEVGHRVAWSGVSIINWHRPLSAYMAALLDSGMRLRSYEEPVPTEEAVRQNPSIDDMLRVPLFHVMEWTKD
jgi:2-polyprenyl-3-methyl-5-hydroxy-6-metoxy-1,4-benzoquinol methylase